MEVKEKIDPFPFTYRVRTSELMSLIFGDRIVSTNSRKIRQKADINLEQSSHVESVCLLIKQNCNSKHTVNVGLDTEEYYSPKVNNG